MRTTTRTRTFHWSAILTLTILPVSGQTFESRHARDLVANPTDVALQLKTENENHRFHMGERIPIVLEFSSTSPEKYKLNGATYDRSGRLPTEEFILDGRAVDPYRDYFGTGVLGGLAGGIRGYPVLDRKPYAIHLDLNDWFRFDRPGRYRLYVRSHRVSREREPGESGDRMVPIAPVSNILTLEILPPDPAWEFSKLAEIRVILDQSEPEQLKPGGPPVPYNPLVEKIALAQKELRDLATPSAIQLMLDRARATGAGPDTLALIGAHNRDDAISRLDRYFSDPEVGFRDWDIRLRALFDFTKQESPEPLPMYPWQVDEQGGWEKVRKIAEIRQHRFEDLVRAEAIRLIPTVQRKADSARKISAEAIAAIALPEARAAGLVPPEDYGLTRDQLISQFVSLPEDQQLELLTKKWDLVRGPEMIPALRGIVTRTPPKPLPANAIWLLAWGGETGLADTALRRLNELSPSMATAIVRRDLESGNSRFAGFAVRSLPPQDFAGADATFSAMLKTNLAVALPLVAKFGSARLAAQMHQLYDGKQWACLEEQSFLTYFVRTEPEKVASGLLRHAIADREQRGCYRTLLPTLSRNVWNRVVEAQAKATLNDLDSEAAANAATVLGSYAGPEAEPLLWQRLGDWSQKWQGRATQLQANPITGEAPNRGEELLGRSLFDAIGSAKAWVIDDTRRERLAALCIDDWCRQTWAPARFTGPIVIDVSNGGDAYPAAFRVRGYAAPTLAGLESKLAQFAPGSTFRWCPQASNPFDAYTPGQREQMFEDVSAFLATHSMSIEPYTAARCGQ